MRLVLALACALAAACSDDPVSTPDASSLPDAAAQPDAAPRPDAAARLDATVGDPDATATNPDAEPVDTGPLPRCSDVILDLIENRTNATGRPVPLTDCEDSEDPAEYQRLF